MRLAAMLCLALATAGAQDSPLTRYPVVELSGRVARVAFGGGMPSLEVDANGVRRLVRLGSMRYLLEKGFNPKAGMEVRVSGYQVGEEIVARRVLLLESGKSLELRDEHGRPVWRGCCAKHAAR